MTFDTPYASIRRADDTDRQTVVDVLTEAFTEDPIVRWLFPEPDQRAERLAGFYRTLLTHPAAEVYLAGDEGASVWLTMTAGPPPHEDHSDTRLSALARALDARHPDHEPHLYLACMGVISGRQGAGLGSALLRHRLERADPDGLPAYLEASSPRSRDLYRRHGFEEHGPPVRVADSPLLWPMWRRPA
ncbi:GNAT family N-acetyltransferase [Herbidospora mongoliensis]|uniref:GNAT family N-acetyltransferase n=1 Tax=Herbidospora mongoliensis TaxID=688067 RepID=UPI00082B3974|nr:GNAT family N-acetyltransferase [Herbidospora mongoliensis]